MTDVQRVADYIQRFSELIGVPIDPSITNALRPRPVTW